MAPPYKSRRCIYFNIKGEPINGGCPRPTELCAFIHPGDKQWEPAPYLPPDSDTRKGHDGARDAFGRSRSRSPPRWSPDRSGKRRDSLTEHLATIDGRPLVHAHSLLPTSPSSASSHPQGPGLAEATYRAADPHRRVLESSASPGTHVPARADPMPPPPLPPVGVSETARTHRTPSDASAARPTLPSRLVIPPPPAAPSDGSALTQTLASAFRGALSAHPATPQPTSAGFQPLTPLVPAPPPPPTLPTVPMPPKHGITGHSRVTATQEELEQTEAQLRDVTEAARIRDDLRALEDNLRDTHAWLNGLEQCGLSGDAQTAVMSRMVDLEKQHKDKRERYRVLAANIAPGTLSMGDRKEQKAQLHGIEERVSELHALLGNVNLSYPLGTTMAEDGKIEKHETGSKRPFSAVFEPESLPSATSTPPPRHKERASLRRQVDFLADRVNDVEENHASQGQNIEVQTAEMEGDLKRLQLEYETLADHRRLLGRVTASEEQVRLLGETVARMKAQRDAALGKLQVVRADNEAMRRALDQMAGLAQTTSNLAQRAGKDVGAMHQALSFHLQVDPRSTVSPKQVFDVVRDPIQRAVLDAVQKMLDKHEAGRDEVVARHDRGWREDIVSRVQGTLDLVQGLARWSERNQATSNGTSAH